MVVKVFTAEQRRQVGNVIMPGDIASTGGLGVPAVQLANGGVQEILGVGSYAAKPLAGSNILKMWQGVPPSAAQPAGVGLGAGAGIIGPVAMAAKEVGLSPAASIALGLGAGIATSKVGQSTSLTPGSYYGVPFGGPGLAEPGKPYLLKEWHIRMDSKDGDFDLQFYLTMTPSGRKRIFMYNQRTKSWKTWAMPSLAVIGKNMPSHKMITRLRRNLSRQTKDAQTILKLTAPHKLAQPKRRYHRYYHRR